MKSYDISNEEWREYDFHGRVYRILKPVKLFWESGHTMHRVLDVLGVVHCVLAPGFDDCVLRWGPKDETNPVQF